MAGYALLGVKWGDEGLGTTGGPITWSFAKTSGDFFQWDAQISGDYATVIRAAFNRWENLLDLDFVEVADSGLSSIRLGFDRIDGRAGILGQESARWTENGSIDHIQHAEIRFDMDEGWTLGRSGAIRSLDGTDFYALVLHEIGHAIGLAHYDGQEEIMNTYSSPLHLDLYAGDIAGGLALYGAKPTMPPPALSAVYRFYDMDTGDHFYTTSVDEKNSIIRDLKNYSYEGALWAVPAKASDTIDVYRLYDTASHTHFFTTDAAEKDWILKTLHSFNYEGVAFQAYAATSKATDQIHLERFYNTETGVHHFALPGEDNAIRNGSAGPNWVDEGQGFPVHAMTDAVLV